MVEPRSTFLMKSQKSWIRRNAWNIIFLILAILSPYLTSIVAFTAHQVSIFSSYFDAVNRIYEHGMRSGELGGLPYFNVNISEYRVAWNAGGYGSFDAFAFIMSYIVSPILFWSTITATSFLVIYLCYELLCSWMQKKKEKRFLELIRPGYIRMHDLLRFFLLKLASILHDSNKSL